MTTKTRKHTDKNTGAISGKWFRWDDIKESPEKVMSSRYYRRCTLCGFETTPRLPGGNAGMNATNNEMIAHATTH